MTPEESFDGFWDRLIGPWVSELQHDGIEAALLKPLAQHPGAALRVIGRLRLSDDFDQRKSAATLAGFLGAAAPPSLLDELFEAERARDSHARSDDERFETQSVVEDVVFAAARWCRHAGRRPQGLAVLRKVVER